VDVVSVEKGNDNDSPEVVCNRKGEEKAHQGPGNALSQENQDAHGKSNVCGHGDGPTSLGIATVIDKSIDNPRNKHTANGRGNGERRLTKAR